MWGSSELPHFLKTCWKLASRRIMMTPHSSYHRTRRKDDIFVTPVPAEMGSWLSSSALSLHVDLLDMYKRAVVKLEVPWPLWRQAAKRFLPSFPSCWLSCPKYGVTAHIGTLSILTAYQAQWFGASIVRQIKKRQKSLYAFISSMPQIICPPFETFQTRCVQFELHALIWTGHRASRGAISFLSSGVLLFTVNGTTGCQSG